MTEKNLKPETIPEVLFPGQSPTNSVFVGGADNPESMPAQPFPSAVVASHLISSMLNSISGKILGGFSFGRSGSIKIGKYVNGVSGEIALSPNGITGLNSSGVVTFAIDATTGNASFLGTIYAAAGSIGGFTINSSYLVAGSGSNTAGISPSDYPFWAGASYSNRGSAPFRITPDGKLVAGNADITGKITATSGVIGGWTITSTTLSGTNILLDSGGLVLVGNTTDYISMLISGSPVIAFVIGSSVKGILKATTAGSGGIEVAGGDLVLNNNKSVLIKKDSDSSYGGITVSGGDLWLFTTSSNKFYLKDNSNNDLMNIGSGGMIYTKDNKIQLGAYTLTLTRSQTLS